MSEGERYRAAAKAVLEQLDWAIGYLHGIRKQDISAWAAEREIVTSRPEA